MGSGERGRGERGEQGQRGRGGLFPALQLAVMCGGVGVGGAGGQSKCEGDERGFTILTNVTEASHAKFRVCDPLRLS